MVSLAAAKAIKLTPSLLVRLLLIPFNKVENPCLYCPGICLASCPTFLRSGSLLLSPLGYARHPEVGRRECLKCWRCVLDCPLNFELPSSFSCETEIEFEILREGDPMLVSVEGLDERYGARISDELGAGLCVLRGLLRRYDEGCKLNGKSMRKVRSKLRKFKKVISLSPEVSHALGIPFIIEEAPSLGLRVEYSGPVHIPCLLIDGAQSIIDGLASIGVKPTEVLLNSCIKLERLNALTLCPRASSLGLLCLHDLLSSGSR